MRRTYDETLRTLFELMSEANIADHEDAQPWQRPMDASQSNYFGKLAEAIGCIAGSVIQEHWAETNELNLALAIRNMNVEHFCSSYTSNGMSVTVRWNVVGTQATLIADVSTVEGIRREVFNPKATTEIISIAQTKDNDQPASHYAAIIHDMLS